MAINIQHQPAKYSPSGNPLFLTVQSNNVSIVYFKVVVKSSIDNSTISTLKSYVTPDAPTTGRIDLSSILFNYTSTPLNVQSVFITSFTFGYLDYFLEITEMVVSSGAIAPGETITIVDLNSYNADFSDAEFQFYGYRNYYINPITTAKFLSTKPLINKINPWSKEFLYFLADASSTIDRAIVKVYTVNGSQIYQQSFTAGTAKIHRLNISPKNLATSLNVDFNLVTKFEVYLVNGSGTVLSEVKTYTCVNLPCNFELVNVIWKNKIGGLDSYTFINPKETKSVKRSSYQTNKYKDYSISANGIINNSEKTYNVSQMSDYTVNSPILNDWEFVYLTDMLSSEQVYIELSDGSFYPIVLTTTSAEVKRKKYSTTAPRFQFTYQAESNLNIVPNSYLSFGAGLSQIGFSVPTSLSVPLGYFETLIGDGSSLYFTVNHNMQSSNVAIDLVYVSNGQTVFGDVVRVNSNTISVEFATPIATNSVKVMISKLN